MIKRILMLTLLLLAVGILASCKGGLGNGNLIGTVVREGTGEVITRPHLIVGRTLSSPLNPPQSFIGDTDGKFEITVPGGSYTVQISSSADGPFYTWPDPVYIAEYKTTVALFQLPDGF